MLPASAVLHAVYLSGISLLQALTDAAHWGCHLLSASVSSGGASDEGEHYAEPI